MPLYKAFRWVQHIQILTFSHKCSIKNWYFFWCLILGLIFRYFDASSYQNARFWLPLAPRWAPNGTPNRPSGAKRPPFSSLWWRLFQDSFPRSLSESSWAPFSKIWMDLGWIFMNFGIIVLSFFGLEWPLLNHQPNISGYPLAGWLYIFSTFFF